MELATIFRLLVSKIWILIIIPIVAAVGAYLFSLTADKKIPFHFSAHHWLHHQREGADRG
jgi:hypothetical protein